MKARVLTPVRAGDQRRRLQAETSPCQPPSPPSSLMKAWQIQSHGSVDGSRPRRRARRDGDLAECGGHPAQGGLAELPRSDCAAVPAPGESVAAHPLLRRRRRGGGGRGGRDTMEGRRSRRRVLLPGLGGRRHQPRDHEVRPRRPDPRPALRIRHAPRKRRGRGARSPERRRSLHPALRRADRLARTGREGRPPRRRDCASARHRRRQRLCAAVCPRSRRTHHHHFLQR